MIFVFGSNLSGIHGAGAAKYALDHEGAVWGQGRGLFGNSYAIPTKDFAIQTLPLAQVASYVGQFIEFARKHPTMYFKVTQIGCGLAGFTPAQIAPLFAGAPKNCQFDRAWRIFMLKGHFWN